LIRNKFEHQLESFFVILALFQFKFSILLFPVFSLTFLLSI